ncbi:MAG: ABC transporter ATP-binding protein [Rhodobiaceae bacterium]|nr:ABC transporter ATP-binding protein [Rhodobiaceae bacterium]MCC0057312.1 ABC transporter ATP-binding protein [Rhodobiaceae bacterium]
MIEAEHLTKQYGPVTVVDDVSLVVPARKVAAIVGTSGSGKTTLLRMINRLVEPTSGIVRIDGEDTRTIAAHELRRRIGYVIQGHGLFPHRTVAQNIATVPQLLKWKAKRIDERVDELLELFQMPPADFRLRMPHELSGGQQQRVGVARALASGPNLLLMDEPFGALDPIIRTKAQDDLLAIQRRFDTTIILVTHDMNEAIRLADLIGVMDEGRLLQYGPPGELIARPASPFIEALLGAHEGPFQLLSLITAGELAEPGEADGEPVDAESSARDAYADLLWSGRTAAPVERQGAPVGRITLEALAARAARPS